MQSQDEMIKQIKDRLEIDLKDHILTEEANTTAIKAYLFKKPRTNIYLMRIIETPQGIHLEGDIGTMQIDYKSLSWLAYSTSRDYMLSKLDHDLHKQDTISAYKVKNLVDSMVEYAIENRKDKWADIKNQYERNYKRKLTKVILFTDEERDFFQELKDCDYDTDWPIEVFYENLYELGNFWQWTCEDGLNITDYSWHTYFQFFALQHAAQKIMEYRENLRSDPFLLVTI